MANRYWVGGSAAWNNTAGTKWASTSGGVGGQSVPSSTDDVFFDAASGTGQVYVESATHVFARHLNFTGFAGEFTNASGATAIVAIYGDLTLSTTMNFTYAYQLNFQNSANGTQYINSNGVFIRAVIFITTSGTGESTHQVIPVGTLNCSLLSVNKGHFNNSNNVNVNLNQLKTFISSAYIKTISMGNGTWTFQDNYWASYSDCILFENTNFTFNCGTSTIRIGNNALSKPFTGAGKTFYNIELDGTLTYFKDSNTFNNMLFGPGKRVVGEYDRSNMNGSWSSQSAGVAFGQSFNSIYTQNLSALRVVATLVGSPTGTMVAKLYAHSGTYGTNGVPTGTALATSDTFNVTDIGPKSINYNVLFNFTGANQYRMTAGTNYFLCIERSEPTYPTNYVKFYIDTTSPTATGNFAYTVDNVNWTSINSQDLIYYIYAIGGETNFTTGTTQTVSSLSSTGTSTNNAIIKSLTQGFTYTISDASGTNTLSNMQIQDCIASGGATFSATSSIDLGNNTGWVFSVPTRGSFLPFL